MSKKIAFIFPGQGAQFVGMMRDFYDNFSSAKQVFQEADERLKMHLTKLIFEGPSDELTLTKNSQLAIFTASYAVLKVIEENFKELVPSFTAGLSLGEYTALVASKRASFSDCLPVVGARGQYMNDACEEEKGTLNVVLGMLPEEVEKVLSAMRPQYRVWIANLNCPGQVVIAGDITSIAAAQEELKKAGAKRVMPLDVSGAFHSALMQKAQDKLKPMLLGLSLKDSSVPLVMNVTGEITLDSDQIRNNLVKQVTSPVYWEKGIRSIMDDIGLFIEMGPGKTLQGMNKRIGVQAPTISIDTVASLDELTKAKEILYASS